LANVACGAANITEHFLDDSANAASLAALRVAEILRNAISARGVTGFALSGGRSPIDFFHELSRQNLAWEKVSVTLVDERWVPPDSDHSNEKLVREHLLRNVAKSTHVVPLKTNAASPSAALVEREAAISQMPWPLDAIVLGMGEDGHTASLFPGAENLANAMDMTSSARLCAIDPPDAEHQRISLTLRGLLETRHLLLLIQNPRKRDVYERARHGAEVTRLPIAAVLRQDKVPVEVFWSP
jgi:6-phosphogluconolactonase